MHSQVPWLVPASPFKDVAITGGGGGGAKAHINMRMLPDLMVSMDLRAQRWDPYVYVVLRAPKLSSHDTGFVNRSQLSEGHVGCAQSERPTILPSCWEGACIPSPKRAQRGSCESFYHHDLDQML